jgi:acyl-CoA thioester hydrolase
MKSQNSAKSTTDDPPTNPASSIEIRETVRYSETDQMGVAHNKNYFEWFELGRTEFCRQKGLPYKDIENQGHFLVVAEAYCRYKKPLKYDDKFFIRVSLKEATRKKVVFDYALLSENRRDVYALGHTVHIATNSRAEVTPLPSEILDKIKS